MTTATIFCKIMNSLLSVITTFYALVLLYFPSFISRFLLSPVLLFTLILLLYLLQLGAAQRSNIKQSDSDSDSNSSSNSDSNSDELNSKQTEQSRDGESVTVTKSKHGRSYESDGEQTQHEFYADSFVEWDVRAPLEVIYEECEGEDADGNDSEAKRESQMNAIRRYASLSLFYPDSDSDCSSEGDSPANRGWEEEDDREGLIEIALDEKRRSEVDEENLIEIDLSPER